MEFCMNASSRRLAACLIVGISSLVATSPSPAGAIARPRTVYPQQPAGRAGATVAPHLNYYGGHVLSHVKVDVVVWNSWSYGKTVPLTGAHSISSFFAGITASKYLDWLSEYDTPTQHIKRGTLEGVYTVHPPSSANGKTVTGAQLGAALRTLIDTGQLPKPSTDRIYAIFFRSGQTIVTPDGNSADDFCAYHDTMAYKSSTAYFAVVPYELRNAGCKPASTSFDNLTTVVSHELIEGITDPGVGLNKLAWYDQSNGEAADICAGAESAAPVTGGDGVRYMVQRIWSNRAGACIVTR
jgi:hypothetical protein